MNALKSIFISCLLLMSLQINAAQNTSMPATFLIIHSCSTHGNCNTTGEFTFVNNMGQDLKNWKLGFNSVRPFLVSNDSSVKVDQQIGDFYLISMPNQSVIPAGGQIDVPFQLQYWVTHITDAPQGYFIVADNLAAPIALNVTTQFIERPLVNAFAANETHMNTAIENNPIKQEPASQVIITPRPANIEVRSGPKFNLTRNTIIYADNTAQSAAKFFATNVQPALGFSIPVNAYNPDMKKKLKANAGASYIVMTTQQDSTLGPEGYKMVVQPGFITIVAQTDAGFFYAIQSLRQLLPPQIFAKTVQANVQWQIPQVAITDYPRFSYRGAHLDVARHFFTADEVKRLLDLMAIHKLNMFHWHLADDEGWRVEIKQFPQLTQIGAYRGFNLPLQPTLGSGAAPYGGYYMQDQIRDIVNYAKQRHITIIPEIDTPGHARALIKSMQTPAGNPMQDPNDTSEYTTVQGYHDNVISPCVPGTYDIMDKIIGELASLFPGEYIHIGGDELPQGVWTKSPACQAYMAQYGIAATTALQSYYAAQLQQIAKKYGKKIGGWEEIVSTGDYVGKDATIYIWNNPDDVKTVAAKGYDVVLNPAQYLYFDLAYSDDPPEPGYYWAGFIDAYSPYSFPTVQYMTPDLSPHIRGVQGDLWAENLISQDRLDYMGFPKMAGLAELAWTPADQRQWYNFSHRLGEYYLPMLDYYGVNYRLPLPGLKAVDGGVEANIIANGLTMRYTTDGSSPTPASPVYQGIIKGADLKNVSISSFNSTNTRSSRVMRVTDN